MQCLHSIAAKQIRSLLKPPMMQCFQSQVVGVGTHQDPVPWYKKISSKQKIYATTKIPSKRTICFFFSNKIQLIELALPVSISKCNWAIEGRAPVICTYAILNPSIEVDISINQARYIKTPIGTASVVSSFPCLSSVFRLHVRLWRWLCLKY